VEEEIAEAEAVVARLEARLSSRWDDRDLQRAHRDAKATLESLLVRWEKLAEQTEVADD
jgi:DNA-binding transcriptional regulator GbsR (MarR family)